MREPFAKYVKSKLKPPFLLIACGLPGTWKTETTEEVHKIKGGKLLRTDLIRLEVLKNQDVFDAKVAGDMKKRTQVYDVMFEMADEAFERPDVEHAILHGSVQKKMTRDPRGTRYLIEGPAGDGRLMHVVCRFHEVGTLLIITVYAKR